jgi:ferredoxin-NADP reductase
MTDVRSDLPIEGTIKRGRAPLAPPFVLPLIDTVLHARPVPVVDLHAETPTILSLRVERPRRFHHRAGQFAVLRLDTDEGPDLRPLSIASAPEADVVEFATRVGPSAFKRAFAALAPGDTVKLSRPLGSFRLDPKRPAVMVSGGIGITPLRSMLLAATTAGHEAPIRLLFSNRTADEIPYGRELADLSRRHPDLRIIWVLSGSPTGAPEGDVRFGRIDEDLLRRQVEDLPDAAFYLTGPAAMVSDLSRLLRSLGVPKSRVRQSKQTLPIDRRKPASQESITSDAAVVAPSPRQGGGRHVAAR